GLPGRRVVLCTDRQAGQEAQADVRLAGLDQPDTWPAARSAGPARARGQPDRRLLRTIRTRPAVGIRRPHELEVQPALLPCLGELPGRPWALAPQRRTEMNDGLEEDEPCLPDQRWPMAPTHLLPRERW